MNRKFFISLSIVVVFVTNTLAQIPTNLPNPDDNTPIDLTKTADILIYIVLPVIILLLLFLRVRNKKK